MEWLVIVDEDKDNGDYDHTPGQGDPEVHSEILEVCVELGRESSLGLSHEQFGRLPVTDV